MDYLKGQNGAKVFSDKRLLDFQRGKFLYYIHIGIFL